MWTSSSCNIKKGEIEVISIDLHTVQGCFLIACPDSCSRHDLHPGWSSLAETEPKPCCFCILALNVANFNRLRQVVIGRDLYVVHMLLLFL